MADPIRIPLANDRGFALVDAADAELVGRYRWRRDSRSDGPDYALTLIMPRPARKSVRMHVLLMGQPGIDHVNGDGLDNRRVNLRPAAPSQNNANMRSRGGCTSRFKGVCWYKAGRIWVAQIQVEGCRRYLGRFPSEEDAARAYDAVALAAWGKYALLNFPVRDG